MTSIFTTTNTDRARWQARGLRTLNEVWQCGAAAHLRPLMWSLGAHGVAGYASSLDDGEATLRAWADLLGLEVVQVIVRGGTTRRLYAKSESWGDSQGELVVSVDLIGEVDGL